MRQKDNVPAFPRAENGESPVVIQVIRVIQAIQNPPTPQPTLPIKDFGADVETTGGLRGVDRTSLDVFEECPLRYQLSSLC